MILLRRFYSALIKTISWTLSRYDSLGAFVEPFIDKTELETDRQVELLVAMAEAISTQYQRRVATINRQDASGYDSIHTLRVNDIATWRA